MMDEHEASGDSGHPSPAPDTPLDTPGPETPAPPPPDRPSSDECAWAMACHLTALAGFVGIPFGTILGPLIIWLIKKDEMPFVDDQGKEALNFQITVLVTFIVLGVLSIIPLVFCVTIPLLAALAIASVVMVIVAAVQANGGQPFRYPCTVRVIK